MKNNCGCKFCDIVSGRYIYPDIDKPLLDNNRFISIASIGAIVEGWTLIIAKDHVLSMKDLYVKKEFSEIINKLLPVLIDEYGPVIMFEHGSNKEGSLTACGTNHAHIHLVPFNSSLISELFESNFKWTSGNALSISGVVGDNEYLFYNEIGNNQSWNQSIGYIHILSNPISQYFRKIIAKKIEFETNYDYKRFPFLENAKKGRQKIVNNIYCK